MNWYIVQAYSGFEKKVVESIKDELKKHKLSEKLEEILVPTHQVTEVKKGKRTKKEKKFFPGYVLIKIELTKGGQSNSTKQWHSDTLRSFSHLFLQPWRTKTSQQSSQWKRYHVLYKIHKRALYTTAVCGEIG